MAKNRQIINESFVLGTVDDFTPQDHLVRSLNEYIDWDFIYKLCDPLYSDLGAPRIDPVVLFKMMFINIIFGIHSMRKTCKEIEVNIAYKWFLGFSFQDKVPDHSTFSQNYARKYKNNNISIQIFENIIQQLLDAQIVDPSIVFVDGTHLKANANKNKCENKEVAIAAKRYQKELDDEIDKDRQVHNKKVLNRKKKIQRDTKQIKKSTSDPDCGYFHKGEKEKCFAYNINTACDKNGYVLGMSSDPGNVHDSVAFYHLKDYLDSRYGNTIETYVADTGYTTPALCHEMMKDNKRYIVPKKRSASRKGYYGKWQYSYDKESDIYVCPLGVVLKYSTTNKSGNRQYKSNPKQCITCPNRMKCTSSQNNTKVIERHIWDEEKELCIKDRNSEDGKEIYAKRKQTIERVFADGKRRHGLDYTLYTGYERVYDFTILTFAGMNIKKLCTYYNKLKAKCAQNTSFEHQDEKTRRVVGLI